MARPTILVFDAQHQETIVTEGMDSIEIYNFGINSRSGRAYINFDKGTKNPSEDGLDFVTTASRQHDLESQDFTDFYIANKTVIDDLLRALYNSYMTATGTTGTIKES